MVFYWVKWDNNMRGKAVIGEVERLRKKSKLCGQRETEIFESGSVGGKNNKPSGELERLTLIFTHGIA